ncbi:D-2-hydroxyacid dehydrogenase [Alkalicoccus urumqiensis]|uniref:D-2-hydroxyacid dehydrogenase n=1 Tax=Alkalicoccus urumqiensis TaxID=1548213 RepID=A0A2P6MGT3_ALKUR|nr:D-2-hydroxyacid dehydrogenase [Alkalicoccus urumqiensis]PRO65494.1 D-2-hydroxyacid dehydrogenase [Alkalicoccus urumqiensis]
MIVVSSAGLSSERTKELEEEFPEVDFRFHPSMKEAEQDLPEAEVLLTFGEDVDEEHITMAASLKWINIISAGMDKMPFQSIKERDILVTNARGIHGNPMAEYTFHMMLHVSRQMPVLMKQQDNAAWDRSPVMTELRGKTLLTAGTGAIASETARLGKAFHMRTIGINRTGSPAPHFDETAAAGGLEEACREADFIVSVLPKMPETDHFFTDRIFQSMKPTAVFINIGRGNAVDEKALLNALEQGRPAHAVLDVFQEEPLPASSPFWEHPHVTVTPHLSGISPEYLPRACRMFADNLTKYLSGSTSFINPVDPEKGY